MPRKTLEDCQKAWTLRSAYLHEHPDDEAIIDAGESLSMLEEALHSLQNKELAKAS